MRRRAKVPGAWVLGGLRVLGPRPMPVCVVPPPPWPGRAEQPGLRDGTPAGRPAGGATQRLSQRGQGHRAPPGQGVCLGGGVEGTLGRRGCCLQPPHPNPCPRPHPQEQNGELQAKYQKLLVRRPQDRDGRGWEAGLWAKKCVRLTLQAGWRRMKWGEAVSRAPICEATLIALCS